MMKYSVLALGMILSPFDCFPQEEYSADELSNMVVCLVDNIGTQAIPVGTGIIIVDSSRYFLVTASHVSDSLKGECLLFFRGANDRAVFVPLKLLCGLEGAGWIRHSEADISVIELFALNAQWEKILQERSFPLFQVLNEKAAVPRDVNVIAMGYPLLDEIGRHFSPLTFNSFFSSGLLTMRRADTRTLAVFQLLENPSVQGYSGGPVFAGVKRTGVSVCKLP